MSVVTDIFEKLFLPTIASPIVQTGTEPILEMMEAAGIPNNDFSLNNLGYELDGRMTVTTNSNVLLNYDRCTRRYTYQGKGYGELLTVVI